jgi:hypothetical protein
MVGRFLRKCTELVSNGVRLVQDLTMDDRAPTPGSHDDQRSGEPAEPEQAGEAALTHELLRLQERHREGGIDPELALSAGDEPSVLPAD